MLIGLVYLSVLSHAVGAFVSTLTWGHALDGHELVTIHTISLVDCYNACRARRMCFSLTYRRCTHTCKLSNVDAGTSSAQLGRRMGYVYSSKALWTETTLAPECVQQCSLNEVCEVTSIGVSCAIKECRAPPVLDTLSSIHGNVWSVNAVVMYECNDDNNVTQQSTCLDTGEWSLQTFQCPIANVNDGLNGNTYVIENTGNYKWWVEESGGAITFQTQPTDDTSKFIFFEQLDGSYQIVALSSMDIVHDGFDEENSPLYPFLSTTSSDGLYTSSSDVGHTRFNVVPDGDMYRIYTVATNRPARMDTSLKVTTIYNIVDNRSLYKLKIQS